LRQLLIALSRHYDRVLLDGPAILGLADCRMLGRMVDAALLVVRSGTHELRPLQRAKATLEQSHVVIAGVVFNALFEDLQNWSSYGPNTPYGYPESNGGPDRALGSAGGLDVPSDEPAALPAVGSSPA
jgi:Mrp family chromosome partitioning ATPase